jgi:cytochrome c5
MIRGQSFRLLAVLVIALFSANCSKKDPKPEPGTVRDEAMMAGRTADSFPAADDDYFSDMDGAVALSSNEVKGRNNWIVWTGGNDRFWDHLVGESFGAVDLLKIISSHPKVDHLSRNTRWRNLGLVNEPCFEKPKAANAERFGLWLDTRSKDCPPDPFENEKKYPGVEIGARRKNNVPVGSYYGYASGIVGLRLFPNPAFDEAAQKKWDAERFYTDPEYYNDKNLIRPYRVGMSCGFCHVGPSPVKPPADPENPKWENLNSNPGTQYFWVDRILFWNWKKDQDNFIYQLIHTSLPGTLDTSFISTDYINNPRTMNAVYSVAARLKAAERWGQEKLAGGGLKNKQFQDFKQTAILSQYYTAPDMVRTPRILKDGADSVGVLGALNRVFINIGLFSEEWLLHFKVLLGGQKITPIRIEDAEKNSSYWNATVAQTADVALFFLKTAQPDLLKNAPGGEQYLSKDKAELNRGKTVFAVTCARCHSSKIPEPPAGVDEQNWEQYWKWTKTDDFRKKMTAMVMADDFLTDNYLSTDRRIPVTLLQTNACSPLATNALGGNIWDNFSSDTYKRLPSVGKIQLHNPIDGSTFDYNLPDGGRGYTRVPSLISLWSTAPFLLNNSVGKFNPSPSVEGRMESFNDSIEQMLWPEKRKKDVDVMKELGLPESRALDVPGFIYRTDTKSYIKLDAGFLPERLRHLLGWSQRWFPWIHRWFPSVFGEEGIKIGPIPKGTPVGLLTNIDVERALEDKLDLVPLLLDIKVKLRRVADASDEEQARVFREDKDLVKKLINLSKCPDYVVNKGHYFGTSFLKDEAPLSDDDKRALIEYLKTF